MANIILNVGREKSLLRRHPWIFSGGIHHADEPSVASGSTVDLFSSDKQFLARASYSPQSQIRARVWTFNDEPLDKEFFRRKIRSSLSTRQKLNVEGAALSLSKGQSNAYRLIYAESD